MKEFNLGSEVVVSDPCYVLPTWCQAVITGVLPGKYIPEVGKTDEDDGWGVRISRLSAIHEDFFNKVGLIEWEESPIDIGVDSGQCGIFDKIHYRNDKHSESYSLPMIWGGKNGSDNGDLWYERMSSLTLGTESGGVSDDDWGVTPDGVVSSSGYGDGVYTLMIGKIEDDIVAFEIIYIGGKDRWEDDGEDRGDEGFPDEDDI